MQRTTLKSKVVLIDTERAFQTGVKLGKEFDKTIQRAKKEAGKFLQFGLIGKRTKRQERAMLMTLVGFVIGLGPSVQTALLDDSAFEEAHKMFDSQKIGPDVVRLIEDARKELRRRVNAAPKRRRRVR